MAELLRLYEPAAGAAHTGDVIFVHGLDGHPRETWLFGSEVSWLTLLSVDRPDLRILSVGYDAAKTSWIGATMPLSDRAVNVLATLEASEIGTKPVCFIVHSMGGLVVKQMIREATDTSKEYRRLVDATRGIVFLATPHTGSDVAALASYLTLITSVSVKEQTAHAPALRELNRWFRNNLDTAKVAIKVFFETKPYLGAFVVNESSADPGLRDVTPIPVEADHVSICKVSGPDSFVYGLTKVFLKACLPQQAPAVEDPLATIRKGVISATTARDLAKSAAELRVFLAENPKSVDAIVLLGQVQESLDAAPGQAIQPAPSIPSRQRYIPRPSSGSLSFLGGALIAVIGLGGGWTFLSLSQLGMLFGHPNMTFALGDPRSLATIGRILLAVGGLGVAYVIFRVVNAISRRWRPAPRDDR